MMSVEIHHFIGKILCISYIVLAGNVGQLLVLINQKRFTSMVFNCNGEKMSKSRGTFILARDYAQQLDTDILRYYYACQD